MANGQAIDYYSVLHTQRCILKVKGDEKYSQILSGMFPSDWEREESDWRALLAVWWGVEGAGLRLRLSGASLSSGGTGEASGVTWPLLTPDCSVRRSDSSEEVSRGVMWCGECCNRAGSSSCKQQSINPLK